MRFCGRPTVLFWLTLLLSGYLSAPLWARQVDGAQQGTSLPRDVGVEDPGGDIDGSMPGPDGKASARLWTDQDGRLTYSIEFNNVTVVEPSSLGITVDGVDLGAGVRLGEPEKSSTDETYATRGVHALAVNRCNIWRYPVTHLTSGTEFSLVFRVFNDGAAYRYIVPGDGKQHVDGEISSWKIMPGAKTWYFERLAKKWKLKSYAGEWLTTPIENLHRASPKKVGPVQGTPLVFELPDDLGYAAITKAATCNYSGMRINAVGDRTLVADFTEGEKGFDVEGDIVSPWRVTMLAADLNALVNSDLIKNLNPAPDPKLFSNTGYLKPGRSAWSWETLGLGDVATQREFIDLAAEMGFEYSTVDDGWKDWDQPWETMKSLCDQAKAKNVGVWLWVDSADIRDPANEYHQMRDYFDKVVAAGSVGLKIDFMNGESKELIDFEIAALRSAAERKLMINFHGCHASTGEERTYPNEMTREGIRGLEVNKMKEGPLTASHNAALPFTRYLVGHADYTPILFTNPGPTTWAHQIATLVTYTTGLQTFAEHPKTMMEASPLSEAFPVLKRIPNVWDETIVLPGSKIGDLAAFARRSGKRWCIGIVNGADVRSYKLDLSFLPPGKYEAMIVRDDLEAKAADVASIGVNINTKKPGKLKHWTTTIPCRFNRRHVTASNTLNVELAAGGGFVAVLETQPEP